MELKKIIIFGAGRYGRAAVKHYGKENIAYFVDNNKSKWGTYVDNIPIISVEEFQKINNADDYEVVIASRYYKEIEEQICNMGISRYQLYSINSDKKYYPTLELILNPYEEDFCKETSEKEYNEITKNNPLKEIIRDKVNKLYKTVPLFDHIEIETINRCNGVCSFCPVNSKIDPREKRIMSKDLFEKIINELSQLNYNGRIALYSNNEPMLDDRIVEFYKYCRNKLPDAWLFLFTNGTLLTLEKFKELIPVLDELIIDNYNQELKLIPNCKDIVQYCEENKNLCDKVTVVLRKPNEIMTSRGGDAPNRRDMFSHGDATCVLPFKQMIIRPDGKVSLCCNDPIGKNTLGDLTKESLTDVWYGQKFRQVRKALYTGRKNWEHCVYCDTFTLG